MEPITFASLAIARPAVESLLREPPPRPKSGTWSTAQICEHMAASIEHSMSGYPVMRNVIIRATIGRIVLGRFLARGAMSHDRNAPIPGLPMPETTTSHDAAVKRLLAAIDAFTQFRGEPAPHFVYGPVTREQYDRVHAMHIADHLGDLA